MSIPVELPDLRAKTAEYTWAYLLTVRPDATPHLVSLSTQWAETGGGTGAGGSRDDESGDAGSADDGTGDARGDGSGDGRSGDDRGGGSGEGGSGDAGRGGSGGVGSVGSGDGESAAACLLMSVSAGTARNASACMQVTLCYPPLDHDGYSLIVDGIAAPLDGDPPAGIDRVPDGKVLLRFEPTGAVLHRSAGPGFAGSATGCANDCLPVDGSTT